MFYNCFMANRHFGEIGDVWKHLPLAEILSIEKPEQYWESHSGAATYPLIHSLGRDYGVYYFRSKAWNNPILNKSAYFLHLKSLEQNRRMYVYPGSPFHAMKVRGNDTRYHFCDIDGVCLVNVRETAQNLKISDDQVFTVEGDGVPVMATAMLDTPAKECANNLAFIDPFRPFVRSANNMNSLDLFSYLAGRGVKTVFWYGYDSDEYREMLFNQLRRSLDINEVDLSKVGFWCGDINLVAINDATFDESPGILGSGIICANLSKKAVLACDSLGKALEKIYTKANFPDGHSGAIEYRTIEIAN